MLTFKSKIKWKRFSSNLNIVGSLNENFVLNKYGWGVALEIHFNLVILCSVYSDIAKKSYLTWCKQILSWLTISCTAGWDACPGFGLCPAE